MERELPEGAKLMNCGLIGERIVTVCTTPRDATAPALYPGDVEGFWISFEDWEKWKTLSTSKEFNT
jgi:hypothetical protein